MGAEVTAGFTERGYNDGFDMEPPAGKVTGSKELEVVP
jgi:hypothetical protein